MFNDQQYRPSGFSYLPVVTKNLIIINVLVFFATYLLHQKGIDLVSYLGLHHYQASDFRPHQFVTYMFMHANLQHIFFNMFGVYIFGQVLEQVWGSKRYLIFYIVTGIGAGLTHFAVMHFQALDFVNHINDQINSGLIDETRRQALIDYKQNELNQMVVVGASGALFGLLGGFGMLFPNRYIYIYFLIPIKAKWLVILYGAAELFSGMNSTDNVAHFAHIGGLVVGIIIVLIWRRDRQHFY